MGSRRCFACINLQKPLHFAGSWFIIKIYVSPHKNGLIIDDKATVYAAGQEVAATGIYGNVEMEAVFAPKDTRTITPLDGVKTVTDAILFDEECGFARVDNQRVTAAKSGDTVTVTAAQAVPAAPAQRARRKTALIPQMNNVPA